MTPILVGIVLVGVAAAVSWRRGLGVSADLAVAVLRALVQLGAVALVIQAIFDHVGLSAIFAVGMVAVAALTAARRMRQVPRARVLAAAAIAIAAIVALVPLFVVNAFPLTPRYVIPLAGIVIGGAMKATSLAGLRLTEDLADHAADIDARLALGAPAFQALQPRLRRATVTALVPAIDQTKNVGLVSLPGAFVGMLLGGASPLEAAQVQLMVLFALLGAEALAASLTTLMIARAVIRPGERVETPGVQTRR